MSISPGVSGILPVDRGGTGVTSLSGLANLLSSYISSGAKYCVNNYIGTGNNRTINLHCNFQASFVVIVTGKSMYQANVSFWASGDETILSLWYNSGCMNGYFGNFLTAYSTYISIQTDGTSSGLNYSSQYYKVVCFA